MSNHKLIITDVDGCLLDWEFAFNVWIAEKGYKRQENTEHIFWAGTRYGLHNDTVLKLVFEFNESPCVGFLPALRDSVHYVKKLAELGYVFDVVSSLHIDKYAQMLRANNLRHLFGNVFGNINAHLSITGSKAEFLKENYGNTSAWWIEDRPDHCDSGIEAGLRGILMDHPYNKKYTGFAKRAKNWEEIYQIITHGDSIEHITHIS